MEIAFLKDMKKQRQSKKTNLKLKEQMDNLNVEFDEFLKELTFTKEHDLRTFSPLDAVQSFELQGLQRISEPTRDEVLANDHGMRKLLANMLAHCQPGLLSEEDMEQLSGINGRQAQA